MRWQRRPDGSNWGDFGVDDQIGMMNTLTPAMRLGGIAEAREGIAFTLSMALDRPGLPIAGTRKPPHLFSICRPNSHSHNYLFEYSEIRPAFIDIVNDDAVTLFTQYSTQWDGLSHMGFKFDADGDGIPELTFYNGYRAGVDILGPDDGGPNARALGIEQFAMSDVQGRGALVDLYSVFGKEPATVGYDDLMRVMDAQRVDVAPGDFLCLRTGLADMIVEAGDSADPAVIFKSCPAIDGRDQRLLDWITDSGLVAICADNFSVERYPSKKSSAAQHAAWPLHEHCLFKRGIHIGELWILSGLAKWLAENNRCHFLLTAPPLRLPGAVGSPVTPIATV